MQMIKMLKVKHCPENHNWCIKCHDGLNIVLHFATS